jgi:predicted nucleic acid-binding protein
MMPPVVLDASAALAFVLHDEGDEAAESMLASMRLTPAIVPAIWRPEVLSGLLNARRRRRIDDIGIGEALEIFDCLRIEIDADVPSFATLHALSTTHRLTPYDACYLELAQRRQLRLATADSDLIRAAKQSGVALHTA